MPAMLTTLIADAAALPAAGEDPYSRFVRLLTVFLLAMWVGFEVITKVPQRLHTPLTSGSNAISGVTAVGARDAPRACPQRQQATNAARLRRA